MWSPDGPEQFLGGWERLSEEVDGGPAGSALPEDVHGVVVQVDEGRGAGGDVVECAVVQGKDEHGLLDAVAVGLEQRGESGAAAVLADVVGDDDGHRHDSPVQARDGSTIEAARRCAWR